MVVRKPTYKTWRLDFQGIETIHINHHTSMPLATLPGLALPHFRYFDTFWGSKNNGNGCRTNAVKRKVVWVLSWRLNVATVGNFRWVEVFLGPGSRLQRCCFCSKGIKASNCGGSFQSFKIINIPATFFPKIGFKDKETHTSFKFKMNVAAPLTSIFAGHLPSFPPPSETLDLRRQSCWDEIEGSVRVTFQGGEKWCGQPGLTLAQEVMGWGARWATYQVEMDLKPSYKWLYKWVTGVISPLWVEL